MTYPELYILRHGETVWNAEGRMQGWSNAPLTPAGEKQAVRQGEILRCQDLTGFRFYTSPLGRSVQTAAIALSKLATEIHTDTRLREIGVGDWAGLLRRDLPMPSGSNSFMAQYEMAPNGEGFEKLKARCQGFLDDLQGPAVLVTHGVTSAILRGLVIGDAAYRDASPHAGQGAVYHVKDGKQALLD